METCSIEADVETGVEAGIEARNILCVTDLSQQAETSLARAFEAAERYGLHLELVHVVDLSRAPSMPDAHMGIRFVIESLARKLQTANRAVTAMLLFGCPEKAIADRANDSNAALVAFAAGDAQSSVSRQILMARIRKQVICPVIDLSDPSQANSLRSGSQ